MYSEPLYYSDRDEKGKPIKTKLPMPMKFWDTPMALVVETAGEDLLHGIMTIREYGYWCKYFSKDFWSDTITFMEFVDIAFLVGFLDYKRDGEE